MSESLIHQFVPIDSQPLEGELNRHDFFINTTDGSTWLRRVPKENPRTVQEIFLEYSGIGFISLGGKFTIRSLAEQWKFNSHAHSRGLAVLKPGPLEDRAFYTPYISDATTLDKFLPRVGSSAIASQLFTDIKHAHSEDIIYGDRWPPNILVTKDGQVIHIDFDIKLLGENCKEFEISQLAYYLLHSGGEEVIETVAQFLAQAGWVDISVVACFLKGHLKYFGETPDGGIQFLVEALLSLLKL